MTHPTFSMVTNMDYENLVKAWNLELVNVVDQHGNTLLMHALHCFCYGYYNDGPKLYRICKFLINKGVNLNVINHLNQSAHLLAILADRYGRQEWNGQINIITSAIVYLIEMKLKIKYSGSDVVDVKNYITMN